MYFSLEKSISSPTDLWRYIGNHPEKFNRCMRREMRAGLEEDSDDAGARRFFRFLRRFRVSLPHHVPVVLDVVCQLIRLNVPETGRLGNGSGNGLLFGRPCPTLSSRV
jgi:hypothetical protein